MTKRKTTLDNPKETKRAIKAAVDQAKKVEQDLERYRNADRWQEAIRMGKTDENK